MKIYLKPNWSEQFIYGDDKSPGYFVGREQEIKGLKNVIGENDSSAVLISSVRGVGKTSFVHKALSELSNICPIFVNIGHALANADGDEGKVLKTKKLILISLIRATRFNKEFENDQKLEDLYKRCFGKYQEENNEAEETDTTKKISITGEIKTDTKTLAQLFSVALVISSLYIENTVLRTIQGFLGIFVLFLSVRVEKQWIKSIFKKKSVVIDNSTEYLEIEFENWLREQKSKSKKIVFVVDELDKIEEKESFQMIKEYKNLFNRSFAHFIFISSQRAFELINEDREKNAEDGGIFPTLFTHVFYLSLPKSDELRIYLNEILVLRDIVEDKKDELINYLLFRSGNDFFDLKRLISDVLSFDVENQPYIETDKIREGDAPFSRIAKLFEYVDRYFLQKKVRELKKYWKDNSRLQKSIFRFLNENFPYNFSINDPDSDISELIEFLLDIGVIEENKIRTSEDPEVSYSWTNKYNRDVKAPLLPDDEKFSKSFIELIQIANDLDELPEQYKENQFTNHNSILEGQDGQGISGINLYSIFSDYEDIFEKLKDPSLRISVTKEKVVEGMKIVGEQVKNIYQKYFAITINTLNKILKNNGEIFKNERIDSSNYNINGVFNSLPEFLSIVDPAVYEMAVYGKIDQTRYVLIIRNFEDQEHITNALGALKFRSDILVINLIHGEKLAITYPRIFIDKIGRKKKDGTLVQNFVNFEFKYFQELGGVLVMIEEFLIKK